MTTQSFIFMNIILLDDATQRHPFFIYQILAFLFTTSPHVNLLLFNPILPTFSNIIIHIDHFHANKKDDN
ncbi:TPA: hypothetical protein PNS88_001609 [Staphylococcus aureus]|nr:hypothetical protein [Staphylococcus aureus]HDI5512588.1 hypothetical protein [Staphylococcus aureus]